MKITAIKEEFKKLNAQEALVQVEALRRELLSLKISVATSNVKDNSHAKKLRKHIARLLTYARQQKTA
jgi:ribosomal protein L29